MTVRRERVVRVGGMGSGGGRCRGVRDPTLMVVTMCCRVPFFFFFIFFFFLYGFVWDNLERGLRVGELGRKGCLLDGGEEWLGGRDGLVAGVVAAGASHGCCGW